MGTVKAEVGVEAPEGHGAGPSSCGRAGGSGHPYAGTPRANAAERLEGSSI